jgi:hypothetical protein
LVIGRRRPNIQRMCSGRPQLHLCAAVISSIGSVLSRVGTRR